MKNFQLSNKLLVIFLVFTGLGLLTGLYSGLVRLGFWQMQICKLPEDCTAL